MRLLALIIFCSTVAYSSSYSFRTTKSPPISATVKSFIATVPPILSQIKNEALTEKVRAVFTVIGSVGVLIYSCLSITMLCDTYFVPTLEFIGEFLSLPTDITGALFTPIGTAGPEVFSSIVGIFFTDNDIGTGAIIGSAVFNLLIIPASCAFTALYIRGEKLQMNPMVIVRDLTLYIIAIISLILVIQDNKVEIIEAVMLLILFILSVIFLYYNAKLIDSLKSALNTTISNDKSDTDKTESYASIKSTETTPLLSSLENRDKAIHSYPASIELTTSIQKFSYEVISDMEDIVNNRDAVIIINDDSTSNDNSDEENCVNNNCCLRLLLIPVHCLMSLTIPKPTPKYFILTFAFSTIWLSLLSYFNITSVQRISDYFSLSDTVTGITILAFTSAVPDLVTSNIMVKKKGLADMAFCSAVSSNRFGILIGLGFPWTIKCMVNWIASQSYALNRIIIASDSLPYISLVLLMAIMLLFFNFKFNGWKLTTNFAAICIITYVLFVTFAIYSEYIPYNI